MLITYISIQSRTLMLTHLHTKEHAIPQRHAQLTSICMGTFGTYYMSATTVLLFFYHLGSAICNVIGEALVVEAGRNSSTSDGTVKNVSTFFAFRKLSFAIMSYLSGFLLNYVPKNYIFLLATILPSSVLISVFWLVEPTVTVEPIFPQVQRLYKVIKTPILLNSTLFIFIMMCTPSAGVPLFYFMTNELKFGPELLGRIAVLQSIASLCGIISYVWFFKEICIRKLLLWSTVFITPFCALPVIVVERWNVTLDIPDSAFVLTDSVLIEFLGEFQIMPILVLAARLCPIGLESTIYSFLLSIHNLGLDLGSLISAWITNLFGITAANFTNLSFMIATCAFTNLLPLCILCLVPKNIQNSVISDILSKENQEKLKYHIPDHFDENSTTASDGGKNVIEKKEPVSG